MIEQLKTKKISIDRLHELFRVDDEGRLIWKMSPSRKVKVGNIAGSMLKSGYLEVGIDKQYFRVHRVIFAMSYGYWPKLVDHINGVRTDNRPSNLREANDLQNTHNSRIRRDNTSGIKGVSWIAAQSKWKAECRVNGVRHRVGYFADKNEADKAIRAFRETHHQGFARHE